MFGAVLYMTLCVCVRVCKMQIHVYTAYIERDSLN